MDLAGDQPLFRCLMDAVLEVLIAMNRPALDAIGDLVDIVAMGDDVGMQDRPVCSLDLYRQMLRPYQERIVAAIREHTQAPRSSITPAARSTATFRISSISGSTLSIPCR